MRRQRQRAYTPSGKTRVQNASRRTVRTLNRVTNFQVSEVNPNGGRRQYTTVLNPLSSFAGASSLAAQHEQFRIDKISVYARVDTTNANSLPAGARISALYSAVNNTTMASYIDYDSFTAPTEEDFLGRDQMKIRSLTGGEFKLVANYVPRVRLSDATNSLPALVPHQPNTWINTAYEDLDWLGLALRTTSDSTSWGGDASNSLKIQLFIKARVSFRGMKKDVTNATLLPSGLINSSQPVSAPAQVENRMVNLGEMARGDSEEEMAISD